MNIVIIYLFIYCVFNNIEFNRSSFCSLACRLEKKKTGNRREYERKTYAKNRDRAKVLIGEVEGIRLVVR